jgi:ABC-type polysaccharide/polyol phosphate transport system ATPase subunit
MIVLHSVSKKIARGHFQRTILDDIRWKIAPRTQIVVLGHRSGIAILLNVIAGLSQPTEGWVERRATLSVPRGFLRYAGPGTTRQLIDRLSPLYNAHPREIAEFIEIGLQDRRVLDAPVAQLPKVLKEQLNAALTYAIPCDFYLFNGPIEAGRDPAFRAFCQTAFNTRRREAGTIVAVRTSRLASSLDENSIGAILYKGKLTVYERLGDAAVVFDSLPPEEDLPNYAAAAEDEEEEDDFI